MCVLKFDHSSKNNFLILVVVAWWNSRTQVLWSIAFLLFKFIQGYSATKPPYRGPPCWLASSFLSDSDQSRPAQALLGILQAVISAFLCSLLQTLVPLSAEAAILQIVICSFARSQIADQTVKYRRNSATKAIAFCPRRMCYCILLWYWQISRYFHAMPCCTQWQSAARPRGKSCTMPQVYVDGMSAWLRHAVRCCAV